MLIALQSITDAEIKVNITIPATVSPGSVNITLANLYGSASIQTSLTSSKLTFSPGQIAIAPGSAGNITASITPSLGLDVTIPISNNNPTVVSVPLTTQIPATGAGTFIINALQEGIAEIGSADTKSVVFVTQPFSPELGETITNSAGPISVVIDQPSLVPSSFASGAVSAYIDQPSAVSSSEVSRPVSAYIVGSSGDPGPGELMTGYAVRLSILIDQPSMISSSFVTRKELSVSFSAQIRNKRSKAYVGSMAGEN